MIQVSDAYKELVKSNIRPKCEPIIKISGIDNTGKEIELIWNAKNIKDLKYKRGIDPVGRELPYMELTWTEIYTGKLNAQSYPEKYNNIVKYMAVELSFVQNLGFYNTWKTLFNGGIKWKDLFSGNITWKQIKNEVSQEVITLPNLFLSAKPTIDGQIITWVAKDFLSFVEDSETKEFCGDEVENIYLVNAISYFLLNARSGFLKSLDLFNDFTNSVQNLLLQSGTDFPEFSITKRIICDGEIKNVIRNLASIYNLYFDFKNNNIKLNSLNHYNNDFISIDGKTLFNYPKIENPTNISAFSFKHRIAETNKTKAYNKKPYSIENLGNSNRLHYLFDGFGEAYETSESDTKINNSIKELILYSTENEKEIYIVPINYNKYENIINSRKTGETFNEDNPINPYDSQNYRARSRFDSLSVYFDNCSSLSFQVLPNIALETNDVIEVETNLYAENGNRIKKKAVIVSIELNYNGTIKQNIKAHEVIL